MIQVLENGKYYHIYNRGINSATLFKEKTNFEHFLKLYDFHINPVAETYAWCLMKNHFHFLQCNHPFDLIKLYITLENHCLLIKMIY